MHRTRSVVSQHIYFAGSGIVAQELSLADLWRMVPALWVSHGACTENSMLFCGVFASRLLMPFPGGTNKSTHPQRAQELKKKSRGGGRGEIHLTCAAVAPAVEASANRILTRKSQPSTNTTHHCRTARSLCMQHARPRQHVSCSEATTKPLRTDLHAAQRELSGEC